MSTDRAHRPEPGAVSASDLAMSRCEVIPQPPALFEALQMASWGVLESWWARFGIAMMRATPDAARAVYSAIPPTVGGARHPALEFARVYVCIGPDQAENVNYFRLIHQLQHAARLHGTQWRRLPDPDVMLLTATYRVHALRYFGAHSAAHELIGEITREVQARTDRGERFTGPRMVEFHYACAMAAFHRGEWAETTRMLNRALWEHDPEAVNAIPQFPIGAHSLFAMVNAFLGSVSAARPHMESARAVARQRQTFPEYLLLGASVAERLGALDVLDEARSAAGEPSATVMEGTEYWAAAMIGCATHDLLYSPPETTLTRVDFFTQLRQTPRTESAEESSMSEVIAAGARADALIAAGKLQRAQALCREYPGSALDVSDARLHLIAGRAADAIRIAENALQDPARTARERGSLAAIAAAACSRLGDTAAAAEWSGRTMAYCREAESVLPVAMLPGDDRAVFLGHTADHAAWEAIATAHDLRTAELLDRVRLLRSVYPTHGVLVDLRLTKREKEILAALARPGSVAQIAAAMYISPNTASTHIRTLYRKLGASSRKEAVWLGCRFLH